MRLEATELTLLLRDHVRRLERISGDTGATLAVLGVLLLKRLHDQPGDSAIFSPPPIWFARVPPEAGWNTLRLLPPPALADGLRHLGRRIEQNNPRFPPVFSRGALLSALGPAAVSETHELFQQLDRLSLRDEDMSDRRVLAVATRELLDQVRGTIARAFTPWPIANLAAALAQPGPLDRIYDPVCGSGELLLACAARSQREADYHGAESVGTYWAITELQCYFENVPANIENRNALNQEPTPQFDVVMANPPFGARVEAKDAPQASDIPPLSEYVFIDHVVRSLSPNGRALMLLPQGVLFRSAARDLRARLIDRDLIDAVIALPGNLFTGSSVKTCLLRFSRHKPPHRKGKIFFIDASRDRPDRSTENEISMVEALYFAETEVLGLCRSVSTEDIIRQRYDLTVSRYVAPGRTEPRYDLEIELGRLERALKQRDAIAADLLPELRNLIR